MATKKSFPMATKTKKPTEEARAREGERASEEEEKKGRRASGVGEEKGRASERVRQLVGLGSEWREEEFRERGVHWQTI
jgi:hypothetical protein